MNIVNIYIDYVDHIFLKEHFRMMAKVCLEEHDQIITPRLVTYTANRFRGVVIRRVETAISPVLITRHLALIENYPYLLKAAVYDILERHIMNASKDEIADVFIDMISETDLSNSAVMLNARRKVSRNVHQNLVEQFINELAGVYNTVLSANLSELFEAELPHITREFCLVD